MIEVSIKDNNGEDYIIKDLKSFYQHITIILQELLFTRKKVIILLLMMILDLRLKNHI